MKYSIYLQLLLVFILISCGKNSSNQQEKNNEATFAKKYLFDQEKFDQIYKRDLAKLAPTIEAQYQHFVDQQLMDSLHRCMPSEMASNITPAPQLACQLLLLALKRKIPEAFRHRGMHSFDYGSVNWQTPCICKSTRDRLLYSAKAIQMGDKNAIWQFVHYYEEDQKDSTAVQAYLKELAVDDGFANSKLSEYFSNKGEKDSALFYFEKAVTLNHPFSVLKKATQVEKREGKGQKTFDWYIRAYESLSKNIGYASEYKPVEYKLKTEYPKEWSAYQNNIVKHK